MSDENRKDEETEIEAHTQRAGVNDEPAEDVDEIEAHVHRVANVRMDSQQHVVRRPDPSREKGRADRPGLLASLAPTATAPLRPRRRRGDRPPRRGRRRARR